MNINLQSGQNTETAVFSPDAPGVLTSNSLLDPTYAAFETPGPVVLKSGSTVSKAGVTRANITVQVPLDSPAAMGLVPQCGCKGSDMTKKFAQVSFTVSLPNTEGIRGNGHTSTTPQQWAFNQLAVNTALQILLNLILDQSSTSAVLAPGKSLTYTSVLDPSASSYDLANPIVRGLAGLIPVDASSDRAIHRKSA